MRRGALALAVIIGLAGPLQAATERKPIKPGFNLFSKEQDIELGREYSQQIEQEVQVVNDKELTRYIERIGQKLAKESQDPEYPFTFKVVNDPAINAFALPGGPIYIHTGLITAADNEAQLAGVVAHEIGHVVLRHSTNQASKQQMFTLPALLAAGVLDQKGGMMGQLAQLGIGFGLNSALLSYSRKAEHDSDIVGARMLAAAGYSPVEMASFFEKLEAASGGSRAPQFFSSHPNPGNRVEYVTEEITGYRQATSYTTNTPEFSKMKQRAARISPPKKGAAPSGGSASNSGSATASAGRMENGAWKGTGYSFSVPKGWNAQGGQGAGMSALPSNGLVNNGIARGILADFADAQGGNLDRATDALIASLQKDNQGLEAIRGQRQNLRIGDVAGLSVFLMGDSPIQGQDEYVWMITAIRPQGLFYLLMISPENEYNSLREEFEATVRSLRFQ